MSKHKITILTKKDLIIETFRGSGKGGQLRNKRDSCVRIKHPDSGAVGYCCDHREQGRNRKVAFMRLTQDPKFQKWLKLKTAIITGQMAEIERKVEDWIKPENLKIECFDPNNPSKKGECNEII